MEPPTPAKVAPARIALFACRAIALLHLLLLLPFAPLLYAGGSDKSDWILPGVFAAGAVLYGLSAYLLGKRYPIAAPVAVTVAAGYGAFAGFNGDPIMPVASLVIVVDVVRHWHALRAPHIASASDSGST
jgi:hypothetical protein